MEYDRRKEDREVKHITLKEKKRAAEIALSGESPLKYLQSLGVRNPTSTWKTIRTYYEKNDPETYAKLPVSGNVKKSAEKPAEPEYVTREEFDRWVAEIESRREPERPALLPDWNKILAVSTIETMIIVIINAVFTINICLLFQVL
jgi:hypothetical protein